MPFSFLLRRDGISQVGFQIKNGTLVRSSGADAARDRIFTALSTQQGEWFLDNQDGIPMYGENGILGGKKTEGEVGAIIRRRILLDKEADRVISLSVVQNSLRDVTIESEVKLSLEDGTSETITVGV